MAVFLLDTNVLVALGWPTHSHYKAAKAWLASRVSDKWATCPMTECGFVRISSNPRFLDDPTTPEDALMLLDQMTAFGDHCFWEDSLSLQASEHLPRQAVVGHQQITDAYLLSLCMERDGILATFDRAILSLASTDAIRKHILVLKA